MAYTYEDYKKMYAEKKRTLQECLDMIQSGDHICFGKDCNEPLLFCQQLHTVAHRVEDVTVLKGRSSDFGFLQNADVAGHIMTQSAFFSKGWQRPLELGTCTFVPNDLHDQPIWYNGANPRNTYIAAVTPMDENGNFQVNLSQMWERDIDPLSCKKIILEVNKNLKTINGGVDINIKDVDAFYEAEYPIYEIQDAPSSEIDNVIGQYVAELVHDGDTIQLGIGSLPNACARNLMDKKDLGIHSEMFTNLMGTMVEKGVINGEAKNIDPGKMVSTFLMGSQRVYDFIDDNPGVLMMDVGYTNDPFIIAKNDRVTAINSALQVDITGQVCADSLGTKFYSGVGGQIDFIYGASLSKGGKAIIAMPSVTNKGISKIAPELTCGAGVVTTRNHIHWFVTENGAVNLYGKSLQERARLIISIADPSAQESLDRAAFERYGQHHHYVKNYMGK